MYDHEKSDLAIEAVKPTNKAGQPAAELGEPRAGAEGNVRQQSTGQAQYRVTVSQALEHTREFRENITTRRYIPEVGAVCPNWARTDLCGGREVTRVPTAKVAGPAKPTRKTLSRLVDLDLWGGWAYLLGSTFALTVEYANGRY